MFDPSPDLDFSSGQMTFCRLLQRLEDIVDTFQGHGDILRRVLDAESAVGGIGSVSIVVEIEAPLQSAGDELLAHLHVICLHGLPQVEIRVRIVAPEVDAEAGTQSAHMAGDSVFLEQIVYSTI